MDSPAATALPGAGDRLARGLRAVFAGLRRARAGSFATWSDTDVAGNAQGFAYAIRATRWQRRARLPAWPQVHAAWAEAVAHGVGAQAWGEFHPQDRWQLVTDNAEAFALRDRLYASALHTIDLSTFYIQGDATGWRTARALADCARRGVRVRVVVDAQATQSKAFRNPQVRALLQSLRDAGAEVRLFTDIRRPHDACHRKLLLVDGRHLLLGGRNHADHYAAPGWRDVELLLTGPGAAAAQAIFDETFASRPGPGAPVDGSVLQATTPAAIATNAAFLFFLQRVRAARHTVDVENAYWFNHAVLQRALADACRRGVRVRLFTNSAESNDLPFMNHRLHAGFGELIAAGVELYLRRGRGRTLHGKYFVVDGEWVGFGSSNFDYYSPRFCLELGLHLRDAALGRALAAWFEEGLAHAQRATDAAALGAEVSRMLESRVFDRWFRDIQ